MCGIAGIVSVRLQADGMQRVQQAAGALQHRGPESSGVWQNEAKTATLAHRRLSIIDLSACAAQPMHYADRYTIIHNGELYNYKELRKDLEKLGYNFTSTSDTEVIVAAYAVYGQDCLQQFDGMFAFAIWDERENKMFAARDRFGEKPFFFYFDEEQLLFASEMKALWAAGIPRQVNEAMLYNFLTIGYTTNPFNPQETFYSNIYKLPTASFLTYNTATNELNIEKYWQLYVEEDNKITDEEAIEKFGHLLSASVEKRLHSDVPVGTSLSGGLDSSAIVAMCAQQNVSSYAHKCFTATFPGFEKDEFKYAAQVAEQYNLQHKAVPVNEEDVLQQMDRLMYFQEEPVSSASVLAQYKVYEAAKQAGVTVLLDGQGADEILAGYHKYFKWYWQQLYRQKGLQKSGELQAARRIGVQEPFGVKNKLAAVMPHFAAALLQSNKAKEARKSPQLHEDFINAFKNRLYYNLPSNPTLNGALFYSTIENGLEELLRLADRNSMAHAVEVRLPFLEHQLVAFLFTLPAHLKIRQGYTKWLLRKSMEKKLPENIVWRKDKTGFEPPQKTWMQNAAVKDRIMHGKEVLVQNKILNAAALKHYTPATAHAASAYDWRYWSASYLFDSAIQ